MGTVAAAAAVHTWTRGMRNEVQGTTEQQQELVLKDIAAFPELSVTDEGVTVTLSQSLVNGPYGYIALTISGYNPPEGAEPGFETVNVEVPEWEGSWSMGGQFDTGLLTDGYRVIGQDGGDPELAEDGSLVMNWVDENGNLGYLIELHLIEENGGPSAALAGKELSIHMSGLGYCVEKAGDTIVDVPGTWDFFYTLSGGDESLIYTDLDCPIGETGATLKAAELSPISVTLTYDWPRNVLTETGYSEEIVTDEDGTEHEQSVPFEHEYYEEPPSLQGVRMRDGSVLMGINGGPGSGGYEDENGTTWICQSGTGKILDPENITSLLFLNPETLSEDGAGITEENCIEVGIAGVEKSS